MLLYEMLYLWFLDLLVMPEISFCCECVQFKSIFNLSCSDFPKFGENKILIAH